jgi:hypothetical protein
LFLGETFGHGRECTVVHAVAGRRVVMTTDRMKKSS